jgi:predicted nucleic acid-binding protein
MPAVLFDTSVYIAALRTGDEARFYFRQIAEGAAVWLSSVVLEELFAGADVRDRHVIERLARDFGKIGRIVVPNLADWVQTGKVLARLAARYGYESIGRGRLTNDALIAVSASHLAVTVVTANARDFEKLAEFQPFQWRVEKPSSS